MTLRHFARSFCMILMALLIAGAVFSQDPPKNQKEKKGRLRIPVSATGTNQPIAGADMIVRSANGEFEESTKTDSQGIANIANVPYGNLRIQIIARGYKTWGGQVAFKNETPIVVKLEPDAKPKPSPSEQPTPRSTPFKARRVFEGF